MNRSYMTPHLTACDGCPLNSRDLCKTLQSFNNGADAKKICRTRKIKAEIRLNEESEHPNFVGVLREGYLRTERILQDGRRSVLSFLVPGDVIGIMAGDLRAPALVAATEASICMFDSRALRRAMKADMRVNSRLLVELSRQHTRQLEMLWRRGALNSRERVVAFIVLATEFMPTEPLPNGELIVSIMVNRKDWADFTNTTVETVSRTLTSLAAEGLVETVARGRYRIRDLVALAEMAGLDLHEDRSAMLMDNAPAAALPRPAITLPSHIAGLVSQSRSAQRQVEWAINRM